MTHYLRQDGRTIVDVDAWKDDLRAGVIIDEYSRLLLETPPEKQKEVIQDFHFLIELRCEFHENPRQTETPDQLVARRLKEIGKKYGLWYVTD